MTLPIDVGSGASDRATSSTGGYTKLDLTNPANLSGLITSVDVWFVSNGVGVRVGIFFLVSGTTYQCRSSATIGSVSSGSKKTFTVNLPVQKGDFIGLYSTSGNLERDDTGGSGEMRIAGEYIDPGDQAIYALLASRALSLYGQGIIKGWSRMDPMPRVRTRFYPTLKLGGHI